MKLTLQPASGAKIIEIPSINPQTARIKQPNPLQTAQKNPFRRFLLPTSICTSVIHISAPRAGARAIRDSPAA